MIFFSRPQSTSPREVGWPLKRSRDGLSGNRWKMACGRTWVDVIVYGNFLLVPMVFSVTSLAENEEGGSGGSGDLKLEKVRSRSVSKWTRKVYCGIYLSSIV